MFDGDDDDFVVVVWANSSVLSDLSDKGGRMFETISKHGSRNPVAWRLSLLQTKFAGLLPKAHLVFSEEDLRSWMTMPLYATSTREQPLLVPLRYARSVLGWNDFDTWGDL